MSVRVIPTWLCEERNFLFTISGYMIFVFFVVLGMESWHASCEHEATEVYAKPLCLYLCGRLISMPTAARFNVYSLDNNAAFFLPARAEVYPILVFFK